MRDVFDYCEANDLPSLAQGMIELPPPKPLLELASRCLQDPLVHTYRSRFGEPKYRKAIQELLRLHYGLSVPIDAIMATNGVTGGVVASLLALYHQLSRPKIRVGLIEPFYTYHFKDYRLLFGKQEAWCLLTISSHDDFSPNWQAIDTALRYLDVIVVCNPVNPSGRVWSEEELCRLINLANQFDCWVILDEVYCDMLWRAVKFWSPIEDSLNSKVIVCRGFSKSLGIQDWRLGYAIASPEVIEQLMNFGHDQLYISTSVLQLPLAEYLTDHYHNFGRHLANLEKLLYRHNYPILTQAFEKAFGWPSVKPMATMYAMLRHHCQSDMEAVVMALDRGVGVAPGNIFFGGSPRNTGYIRIHYGVEKEKAIRIAEMLIKN